MGEFTLDTSGYVLLARPTRHRGGVARRWPDLDAFTQGYVEAAHRDQPLRGYHKDSPDEIEWRFSDLAPETLAAVLKDCAAYRDGFRPLPDVRLDRELVERERGADFWKARNSAPGFGVFPPLTASLGDDGKVYLRGAA